MSKFILSKEVRLKFDEASDKYYAFLIESGEHFNLNKTGYKILSNLYKEKTLEEIVGLLSLEMNVDEKTLRNDTIYFLELSEKNGIIAHTSDK